MACTTISVTRPSSPHGEPPANCWSGRACCGTHCYGTPRAPVEQALRGGQDVVFDIDWQGHAQLRAALPGDVVGVFILPPSLAALEARLTRPRRRRCEQRSRRRMALARDEISHWAEFDHVVVNDDLAQADRRRARHPARRPPGHDTGRSGLAAISCVSLWRALRADRTRPRSASPLAGPARCPHRAAMPRHQAPQCLAQHLAPLAECRRGQPLHCREQRRLRLHRVRHHATTAENTLGGGTNAAGGRRNTSPTSQVHCASIDSRPYAAVPARHRSARRPPAGTSASAAPTPRPDAASQSAAASRCCTADWPRSAAVWHQRRDIHRPAHRPDDTQPARPLSRPVHAWRLPHAGRFPPPSRSPRRTPAAPASGRRARVRPRPHAGPSMARQPRTMRRVRLASSRKCCPSDRRAASPCRAMTSRSVGSSVMHRRGRMSIAAWRRKFGQQLARQQFDTLVQQLRAHFLPGSPAPCSSASREQTIITAMPSAGDQRLGRLIERQRRQDLAQAGGLTPSSRISPGSAGRGELFALATCSIWSQLCTLALMPRAFSSVCFC